MVPHFCCASRKRFCASDPVSEIRITRHISEIIALRHKPFLGCALGIVAPDAAWREVSRVIGSTQCERHDVVDHTRGYDQAVASAVAAQRLCAEDTLAQSVECRRSITQHRRAALALLRSPWAGGEYLGFLGHPLFRPWEALGAKIILVGRWFTEVDRPGLYGRLW